VFDFMKSAFARRELFRRGGLAAISSAFLSRSTPVSAAPAAVGKLQIGPDIYQSIGVRPLINCRGTLTVISGSLELPEVRAAKDAAAAVVAAKANLEKERSDEKNAPQILQSLRAAVAPAQAAAAEKVSLADAAAKRLDEAKAKSQQLEARYADLKKQLGLPASSSPTSTASAR